MHTYTHAVRNRRYMYICIYIYIYICPPRAAARRHPESSFSPGGATEAAHLRGVRGSCPPGQAYTSLNQM